MRFLDVLLGRTKPVKSKLDRLFAISTAYLTLTVDIGLSSTERAAICFRPLSSTQFSAMRQELDGLLRIGEQTSGTTAQVLQDDYGFTWVVLEDPQFEDLVTTIHMVSLTLDDAGFGTQLLAAVFKFTQNGQPVFWIYNYKRGSFYPFVPLGGRKEHDSATELRLRAVMEKELPIEHDLERWYPLWGAPL